MKFYVDAFGKYLGGFDASKLPEDMQAAWYAEHVPAGSIEVPFPPADARQKWNGTGYDPVSA